MMMSLGARFGQSAVAPGHGEAAGFSWTEWHLHPDVLLTVAAFLGLYALAWRKLGSDDPDRRLPPGRAALFLSGVFTLYIASGTPLHELSERYLFSAHMTQHMLLTFVAPPLLIAGTPAWMLRPLLRGRWVMPVARFFANPLVALALFNAATVATHLPPVVDLALRNHAAHFGVHAVLVGTAIVMWWQVYSSLPELPRLAPPVQMGYLFVQSIVPTVPASFLTFSSGVLYDFYAEAPRIWGTTAIADQRVAGGIMKIGGGLLLWGVITVLFFRWYEDEEAEAIGLPNWTDAEQELERMGLTKR